MPPRVYATVVDGKNRGTVGRRQAMQQLDRIVHKGVCVEVTSEHMSGLRETFDRYGPLPVLGGNAQTLGDGGEHVKIGAAKALPAAAIEHQQLDVLVVVVRHGHECGGPQPEVGQRRWNVIARG